MAKPIKITETILRDAHQSLIATRMTTEQMLPIINKMDQVGYHSVECWGGATFDASLRFLKEDPWDRLRKFRDGFKNTKLQMLFRGQNILGYRPYADDVVEYFVQKSIANGIDIIRIFDCMNDLRNLQTAVNAANKEKGHAQVAMSYTLGDAYTLDYWKDLAKGIEDMGANSICIKDMAGLLLPYKAEELVKELKATVDIPIQLHTHYTSGVASMTYMKAVEAGVALVDRRLIGRGVLLLDDALDLPVGIADDAAVAGGVVQLHGEHHHGGVVLVAHLCQAGDGLGLDERAVAGEHRQGTVEAGESVGAGEHRARRAVLHFLHHDLRVALN